MKTIRWFGKIFRTKTFKLITWIICAFVILVLLGAITFVSRCSSAQPNFIPIEDKTNEGVAKIESEISDYRRTEETTYLTLPEWYLVFNPQEYGRYLETNKPSGFPYFTSIKQFWSGYCQVYGITKNHYGFNVGNHVVEVVIGTSFTVEYTIKGVYENTIGRISELLSWSSRTDEDAYAARVAVEYGAFIPDWPWYEFPFGQKFIGLWQNTSLWGPQMLRKIERKFFLSLEYGVKTIYAHLIKLGTHSAFGVAASEIHLYVNTPSENIFTDSRVKKVQDLGDGNYIITVPHYQGFTDVVPELAEQGVRFIDVAGNDEILLTAIAPVDWPYDIRYGTELFSQPMVTDPKLRRTIVQAPIKNLADILLSLKGKNVSLEHLYDY